MADEAKAERLTQIASDLDEYQRVFELRNQASKDVIKSIGKRKVKTDEFSKMIEEAAARLDADPTTVINRDRLNELLDELADMYMAGDFRQRVDIMGMVGARRGVRNHMHGYMHRCAKQLRETRDDTWLLRGLTAAAIEDATIDWRDTLVALGELYLAAEHVRLRPMNYFRQVAEMASPEQKSGHQSTRNMLLTFDKTAHLRSIKQGKRLR